MTMKAAITISQQANESMVIKKQICENLYQPNPCLAVENDAGSGADAAALMITVDNTVYTPLDTLDAVARDVAIHALMAAASMFKLQYSIFLAHGPWQSNSATTRHRRLWGSYPTQWEMDGFVRRGEDAVFSPRGIRFAGFATMDVEALEKGIDILRLPYPSMIVAKRIGAAMPSAGEVFKAAFPEMPDGDRPVWVRWERAVPSLCQQFDFVIRGDRAMGREYGFLELFAPQQTVCWMGAHL